MQLKIVRVPLPAGDLSQFRTIVQPEVYHTACGRQPTDDNVLMTHTSPNESPDQPSSANDAVSGILEFRPELVSESAWIAPTATVRGDVYIGSQSSVWFGTVIRGDSAPVRIGTGSNVQDLCCLHADPGYPCIIGDRVTIGHGAIVHGARVESDALIGIGATVLNGAVIGSGSIVGAGALVPEGKTIPPGSLAVGVPAKVIRTLTHEDQQRLAHGAQHYIELSRRYAEHEKS